MSENYQVSARRFRPKAFSEVIGQSHVVDSLKNSLKNGTVGHAFLFCGPRGVGKTTCARIMAQAINCENIRERGEPCENCFSCKNIKEKNLGGIFELDAASNNSVENIRNVIEQVRYIPQNFKYNVYIIDEVHMLSGAAFNAFLKTLEEPPKHVVFILATTEKNKVLPTILSRCQIFDFKPIAILDIVKNLKDVAEKKSILFEEEALYIIAEKADGGMRDALSILDTVVSLSAGEAITVHTICENLNICDTNEYVDILNLCYTKKLSEAIEKYNNILSSGFDSTSFLIGMTRHIRNLLLIKNISGAKKFIKKSDEVLEKLYAQSSYLTNEFLKFAMKGAVQCDLGLKNCSDRDLLVELFIFSLASEGESIFVEEKKDTENLHKTSSRGEEVKKNIVKFSKDEQETNISEKKTLEPLSIVKIPKPEEIQVKKEVNNENNIEKKNDSINVEEALDNFEGFLHQNKRIADTMLLSTERKIEGHNVTFFTDDLFKISAIKRMLSEIILFVKREYRIEHFAITFNFSDTGLEKNSEKKLEKPTKERLEDTNPLVREAIDRWDLS